MKANLNLLFLSMLAGCGAGDAGDETAAQSSATRVPVHVAAVVRDSISETLQLTGRLSARPGGAVQLTAPAAGVVRSVSVQIGDRVRRGAAVAVIEVPELGADAAQKSAAASVAAREAARQQQLLKDGITSTRQADEAEAASRQAAAAAEAANALLSRTRLASPLYGRVQSVDVQVGARAEAGAPIARIVAVDTLELALAVPAGALRRLRPGMDADIREAGSVPPVQGFVAGIAPGVDSLTGTGTAVVRIPNRDGVLHPGAAATGTLRLGTRQSVLIVPDSALVLAGDSTADFVVGADSVAHQHVVRPGVRSGHRVEIEGDLKPGDHVVTAGVFGLEDGMRVTTAHDSAGTTP
jgi:membrane fusion protein (multidrug efflux system)